jgi:hypothetical protein
MQVLKRFRVNGKKLAHLGKKLLVEGRLDRREKDFIAHNEKIWQHGSPEDNRGEILLELSGMASSVIAFSYLANLLARMHKARIVGYQASNNFTARIVNRKAKKIYRSFNVRDFIGPNLSPSQRQQAEQLFRSIRAALKTKKDVEDLQVEGVWIGDLLYDSHCMEYRVPTIDLGSSAFQDSLKKALCSYVFWRDYLEAHRVRSVIVTHTVYVGSGVITRLAIRRGIPVYQINASHLYYMSAENLWAYNDFFSYPEKFRELPEEERQRGLLAAKARVQRRLSGEVGVDMHYSTKSAYGRIGGSRVLKESPRIKILVATHCFFDSPHPFGVNLFTDFYEWLYFLGEISEETDYDWYIKTHPDFLPGNIPIIEEFIRKYPKFTLIPSETSHLQLKEEGIDFGLTVYGTIGCEYAALGIPVVNASQCNPHIRYHFNLHPRSIEEYRGILLTLPEQTLNIAIEEVYEYYFMAFIHNVTNWLFPDYEGFIREIGGYSQQFESVSYRKFQDQFSESRHKQIVESLLRFVESGEYNLRRKFLGEATFDGKSRAEVAGIFP